MRKLDLTGKRYGRLTVLCESGKNKYGNYMWRCACDCGERVDVAGGKLVSGHTQSCGCHRKDLMQSIGKKGTHYDSQAGKPNHRLYGVWHSMKDRCSRKTASNYKYYGGRGISVCDEWQSFEAFKKWALSTGYDKNAEYGECTIDRIDVDGDYEPSNCRWVDAKTQAQNRRNHAQKSA